MLWSRDTNAQTNREGFCGAMQVGYKNEILGFVYFGQNNEPCKSIFPQIERHGISHKFARDLPDGHPERYFDRGLANEELSQGSNKREATLFLFTAHNWFRPAHFSVRFQNRW